MIGFLFLFLVVIAGVLGLLAGLQFFGVLPRREAPLGSLLADRERVHRLEEALGAVDARLDRLEDQQRFLVRLLEDRSERPSLPPSRSAPADDGAEELEGGVDSILFDVEGEEP